MALNIDATKTAKETSTSLVRRFTTKARGIGLKYEIRDRRFYKREDSPLRRKQGAMVRLRNKAIYEKLLKEGKVTPRKGRSGSRSK